MTDGIVPNESNARTQDGPAGAGTGTVRLGCLLATLAACLVWLSGVTEGRFLNPDAYDYAQMGRQVCSGRGMSTLQIFPLEIPFLAERGLLEREWWPNVHRYPLPILTAAAFQLLVSDPVTAAVWQSGVWYVLSAPMMFLLGFRLAGIRVAAGATLFLIADWLILECGYSGMTESLSTFLLLATLAVAFGPARGGWGAGATGALCALCYLARSQYFFLAPILVVRTWFTGESPRRWKEPLILAAAAMAVASPWWVRNTIVAGNPLFSSFNTRMLVMGAVPNQSDLVTRLHAPISTGAVLEEFGDAIWEKYHGHLTQHTFSPRYWAEMLSPAGLYLLPLFILAFLRRQQGGRRVASFKWVVLALLVCNFLVVGLVLPLGRMFSAFRSPVILIALWQLDELAGMFGGKRFGGIARNVLFGLVLLAGCVRLGHTIREHHRRPLRNPALFASVRELAGSIEEGSVVASDESFLFALLAERRSVRLPDDPADLLEIDERYLPIDYVFLSRRVTSARKAEAERTQIYSSYAAYNSFIESQAFKSRYELVRWLPERGALYRRR